MKKAVLFFLLLSPIFYSGLLGAQMDIREQQLWVLLLGAAFFVGMTHYNRIIGYGVLYCIAHLALFHRPGYMNSMTQILAHVLVYDAVAKHYDGNKHRWALLAVLVLNLIMAALQYFRQDVFLHMDLQTPGLMTLPVYIGIYAAVTAPIIYTIHPALIILSLAGIAVSKSSFAALAMAVSMSFFLWKIRSLVFRVWLPAVLVALIWFIGFYDGPTGQFSRRLHIWKQVGSVIAVNPWGGWGLGAYDDYIRFVEVGNNPRTREYATFQPSKPDHVANLDKKILQVAEKDFGEKSQELFKLENTKQMIEWFRTNGSDCYFWQDPHNFILLAWMELGFPMVLLILWYCWDIRKRFEEWVWDWDTDENALFSAFIALIIVSLAHFAIQLPRLSFTFMILLAVLDRRLKRENENKF